MSPGLVAAVVAVAVSTAVAVYVCWPPQPALACRCTESIGTAHRVEPGPEHARDCPMWRPR